MQQQIGYHNPNIQTSNLEVPVGMVDGILANPRNPVNHDLWLTGRFSTSRQPSLFLSLIDVHVHHREPSVEILGGLGGLVRFLQG